MMKPITITMLGGSNTGKTCFMVGMYGIMRRGVRGFTFAAQDLDDDLKLGKEWKTLRRGGAKRWPPPTDQSKDFVFNFCYALEPYREFSWHDYRGGALESQSSDADKKSLIERLVHSACILLCYSTAHLVDPSGQLTEEGEDEATLLNQCLTMVRAKAKSEGRPLPSVVIVLTKYDLAAGHSPDELLPKVRELFEPLYMPGGDWTVTTCPVTLGKTLAQDAAGGAVEPMNVHLPIAFGLYCTLQREIAEQRKQFGKAQSDFASAAASSRLARWWKGVKLDTLRSKATQTQAELEVLQDKLNLLFRELVDGVEIYHNGEEVEADV